MILSEVKETLWEYSNYDCIISVRLAVNYFDNFMLVNGDWIVLQNFNEHSVILMLFNTAYLYIFSITQLNIHILAGYI